MFLGYQNDKIALVADNREQLSKLTRLIGIHLDRIEETDKTYFLHNGEYVYEVPYEQQIEEIKQSRAIVYAREVDPLMNEYNRKKTFNLFDEGEEEELIAKIKAKVSEIKLKYPYPEV